MWESSLASPRRYLLITSASAIIDCLTLTKTLTEVYSLEQNQMLHNMRCYSFKIPTFSDIEQTDIKELFCRIIGKKMIINDLRSAFQTGLLLQKSWRESCALSLNSYLDPCLPFFFPSPFSFFSGAPFCSGLAAVLVESSTFLSTVLFLLPGIFLCSLVLVL